MPTCSRQILVKDHAFLVKPAYYLKSLYGVRGFCVCDVSVMQGYNKMNFCRFTSKIPRNPIGCGFGDDNKHPYWKFAEDMYLSGASPLNVYATYITKRVPMVILTHAG